MTYSVFCLSFSFDGRKKLPGTKAAREKAALKIKTKREFKGAVREIRKDTQFIARQKLVDQIERQVYDLIVIEVILVLQFSIFKNLSCLQIVVQNALFYYLPK
jgi:hypothetical protein